MFLLFVVFLHAQYKFDYLHSNKHKQIEELNKNEARQRAEQAEQARAFN